MALFDLQGPHTSTSYSTGDHMEQQNLREWEVVEGERCENEHDLAVTSQAMAAMNTPLPPPTPPQYAFSVRTGKQKGRLNHTAARQTKLDQ